MMAAIQGLITHFSTTEPCATEERLGFSSTITGDVSFPHTNITLTVMASFTTGVLPTIEGLPARIRTRFLGVL